MADDIIREEENPGNDQEEDNSSRKCLALRRCCNSCSKPFRTKYHPLSENPGILERFKYGILCPPHGNLAKYLIFIIVFGLVWADLMHLTDDALPGGNIYSIVILFFSCSLGGYLVSLVKLPPLLGMLIVGCVLRNVTVIRVVGHFSIDHHWSAALRQLALTVILILAGLGLDPKALKKLSLVVIRLAFSPCVAECVAEAIAAHFFLGFPLVWGLMLGFVLAAVSPAVVVPCLLSLSDRGYGIDKGVPTLVIAAASIDDVLAITGFGIFQGIAFSVGGIAEAVIKGPLDAVIGVLYGCVAGALLWYLPQRANGHLVFYRILLLFGFGLFAIFSRPGPLGVLTVGFVAAYKWRKDGWPQGGDPATDIVQVVWMIFQPLLFGLIGAEVDIANIDGSTVGLGMATLACGLVVRMIVSFLAVFGTDLTMKERLFIPFAWLPKATVQAAIGAYALDMAREHDRPEEEKLGSTILTIAVLSILVTAPVGAAVVTLTGPLLLKKTAKGGDVEEKRREDSTAIKEEEGLLMTERNKTSEISRMQ